MNTKHAAVAIIFFLLVASVHAQLYLNEIQSKNTVTLADEDGDYSDWVEIYNDGPAVNLSDYYLSINASNLTTWQFPGRTMEANTWLQVWCSKKNRANLTGPLHTNFKLKAGGVPFFLSYANSTIVDQFAPVALTADQSYGRLPDGSANLGLLPAPSPGANNSVLPPPPAPVFSKSAGFYKTNFSLTITAWPNTTVYYTLDGSKPTVNSTIYTVPIPIKNVTGNPNVVSMVNTTSPYYQPPTYQVPKVMTVRAIVVNSGGTSKVTSATYILDGNFSMPVISITTDSANLFDYNTGIYTMGASWDNASSWQGTLAFHPANYENDGDVWERPVHLEVFETNGSRVVDQDIGMRVTGSGSRVREQKSLKLYARADYGAATIPYPLFPDQNFTSYKRISLRNGDDDARATYLRDVLAHQLVKNTSLEMEPYRPTAVFLNGEYWGFYPMRNRGDQFYVAARYGVSSDDVIILNDNAVVDNGNPGDELGYVNLTEFVRTHDMRDPANYAYVQTQMDTTDFARYYAANTYEANTDWIDRNMVYWRYRMNGTNTSAQVGWDGRWRWIMHDNDWTFGFEPGTSASTNMFNFIQSKTWGSVLWNGLSQNEQFRNQYVTLSADQLMTNFAPNTVISTLNTLAAGALPEMQRQIDRWTNIPDIAAWQANLDKIRQFALDRPAYHRQHIAQYFGLGGTANLTVTGDDALGTMQVNTLNITTNSTGIYFQDIPVTLTAYPKPGKVFLGWTGAASGASPTITMVLSQDTTIGAVFADAPDSAPTGASIWTTRKYPATFLTLTEQQNATLLFELANPQSVPTTITWTIDGAPASGNGASLLFVGNGIGNHTVDATITADDVTLHEHWLVQVQRSLAQACFTHLADIPANCTGGSITQDVMGGCRTITCSSAGSSLQILACEKPTASNPSYFEMYRQSGTGNLQICLGTACIGGNGYAHANFPVCVAAPSTGISFASVYPTSSSVTLLTGQNQTFNYSLNNPANLPTDSRWYLNGSNVNGQEGMTELLFLGQVLGSYNLTVNVSSNETSIFRSWTVNIVAPTNDTGNQTNDTNQTNTTVCGSHVTDIPAFCTGGIITADLFDGCRTLACAGVSGTVQVLACDKPGSYNAQYFEMYRQGGSGSGVSLCLGTTCISNGGYAKSPNFPICVTVTNGTNSTGNQTNTTQNISIASRTPTAHNVLVTLPSLQTLSFTLSNPSSLATTTQWLLNATPVAGTTSYVLSQPAGDYNVTVIINSSQNNVSAEWIVTVQNATNTTGNGTNSTVSAVLSIAPWFPQGRSYVYVCTAAGFTPTAYDYFFGDGNKQLSSSRADVYYTYASAGAYSVSCTAKAGATTASGNLSVTVA